ncbi:LCP family protein [Niallia sp. Man26]|uniref:LCP family protein n=1 Tax=Bacillaceae TaxID=186817 RepID=UPI001E4C2B1F|nr:LCP family protein [Niallia sp. Man26]MCE4050795.1 LCP family protein [Bacillus sp. Au-Bac7]MCM3033930.1 LCP family protein [Niallia sp. MER 6]UPO89885.1 LCP family protein [Niallia sp. Man26]
MRSRGEIKKKRKWIRNILSIVILLIVICTMFIIYQYKSGVIESTKDVNNKGKDYDFLPAEPQLGEMNILLLGSDSRGEEHSRSDTLMIAHYNSNNNSIKLASIMRDTYVDIPGHGLQKINAAFAFGGPELVRQTIKNNFDIDVNYYAIADFKGFSKLVDIIAPDGIQVDIPYEMSYGIGTVLKPGSQILHGKDLLGYVRFRHDRLSDFGRVERQQEVMSKLKEQAISAHTIYNLPKIIGLATPYIDTNLDTQSILSLSKGLLLNSTDGLESLRIPIQDSYENDVVNVGAVLKADLDTNKEALSSFFN